MSDYSKEQSKDLTIQLRSVLEELPRFVRQFFRSINDTTQPRTKVGYAYDLKYFFEFLQGNNSELKKKKVQDISLDDLNNLTAEDFEEYLEYLSYYIRDGREYTNDAASKKRKLVAIRVFFKYLYQNDLLDQNVTEKIKTPKIHEKTIVRMETQEVANFLDTVEYGNHLTAGQQRFHDKTKTRDLALMTLMLSTGIRVSECVGLDISDVDFDNSRIKVTRKGGNEAFVFFSDEASSYLVDYIEERKKIIPLEGHENALFLSSQKRRITPRAVENLVKKYAQVTTPMKHITPHKLRSTYGTALYQETGDIYLVASVLGHKDVNTTRKHYAAMDEDKKRRARNIVQLREDIDNES